MREKTYLDLVKFLLLVQNTEQVTKTKPKQDKLLFFPLIFHSFKPFIGCLSVVLWPDKGDFPQNVHTVWPCQNK